jgi:hypothetical protein
LVFSIRSRTPVARAHVFRAKIPSPTRSSMIPTMRKNVPHAEKSEKSSPAFVTAK